MSKYAVEKYVGKNEAMENLLEETKKEFENVFSSQKIRFPEMLEKVIGKLKIKDLKDNDLSDNNIYDKIYEQFKKDHGEIEPGEFLLTLSPSKTQGCLAPGLSSAIEGIRTSSSGKVEKKSFRDFFELRGAQQQCLSEKLPNPKTDNVKCYLCNCPIQTNSSGGKKFFEGADCEHIIPALRAIYFIGLNTNKKFYESLKETDLTKIITRNNYNWSHEDCNRTQGKSDILLVSYSSSDNKFSFNKTNAIYLLSKIRKLGHPKSFVGNETSKVSDPDLWKKRQGTGLVCFGNDDTSAFLTSLRKKVTIPLSVMNNELQHIKKTYKLNHNQALTVYAEMCIEILKLYLREEALKYMVSPEEIKTRLQIKDEDETKQIESLESYSSLIKDIKEKYTHFETSYKKTNKLLVDYLILTGLNRQSPDDEVILAKYKPTIEEFIIPYIEYYKEYFSIFKSLGIKKSIFMDNSEELIISWLGLKLSEITVEDRRPQYTGVFGFNKIIKGINKGADAPISLIVKFSQLLLFLIMYLHYGYSQSKSNTSTISIRRRTVACTGLPDVCDMFKTLESFIFLTLLGVVEEVIELNLNNNIENDTFVEDTKKKLMDSIKKKSNFKSLTMVRMLQILKLDFANQKTVITGEAGSGNTSVKTSSDKFLLLKAKEKYDLKYQYTNFFDLPIGEDIKDLLINTLKYIHSNDKTKYTDLKDEFFDRELEKLFVFIKYNIGITGEKRYQEHITGTVQVVDIEIGSDDETFIEEADEITKLEDIPPPPTPLPPPPLQPPPPLPPPLIQPYIKDLYNEIDPNVFKSYSIPRVPVPLNSIEDKLFSELDSQEGYDGSQFIEDKYKGGKTNKKKSKRSKTNKKKSKRSKTNKKKSKRSKTNKKKRKSTHKNK